MFLLEGEREGEKAQGEGRGPLQEQPQSRERALLRKWELVNNKVPKHPGR